MEKKMDMEGFISKIEASLTKHDYPNKRVALPLEKMYEAAYEKGLNFNKVLEVLAERGIAHEKTEEKVIFYPAATEVSPSNDPFAAFGSMDPSVLKGMKMPEMMAKVNEMLKGMSPDQLAEMQRAISNMTPEQREQMLQQAKQLGLTP